MNVRLFNGRYLVDIREYYEDDAGERKPGRKGEKAIGKSSSLPHTLSLHISSSLLEGISLTLDQWEKLKAAVPAVDEKIHGN